MATYDETKLATLGQLKAAAEKTKAAIGQTFRSGKVDGNTVNFYTSTDKTGTAAFSFDFPSELVLDQLKTVFVSDFKFNATTYPGATDPGLEDQPVLVIAVKDTAANGSVTTNYSFLDMGTLANVDVSDKADKVDNATDGNIAGLDADGNITDSGHGIATDTEVNNMLNDVWA